MSQDEARTNMYDAEPILALKPDETTTKRGRGRYKRDVTLDIAKITIALENDISSRTDLNLLIARLKYSFALFSQYHERFHATLSGTDVLTSEEYFAEVNEDYVETLRAAGERAETLTDEEEPVSAEGESVEERTEDSAGDGGGEAADTGHPLEQRFENYVNATSKMFEMLQTQIATLTSTLAQRDKSMEAEAVQGASDRGREADERSESNPVAITSTPASKRRVSFGGLSRIDETKEHVDAEVEDSIGDKTLSAVLSMADSCKQMAQKNNTSRTDSFYRLPKFKLFNFSGEPIDYLPFMRAFETQVEALETETGVLLGVLINHTTGSLQQTLQCCMFQRSPEAALTRAKEVLQQRYGRYEDVGQAWLEKFHQLGDVTTTKELFELVSLMSNCQATLLSVGQLETFECKSNLALVVNKLPRYMKHRWQQWVVRVDRETKRKIRLQDLIEFCDQIYAEKADPSFGGSLDGSTPEKKPPAKPPAPKIVPKKVFMAQEDVEDGSAESGRSVPGHSTQIGQMETVNATNAGGRSFAPGCLLCKGDHVLSRCNQLATMTVEQRYQAVFQLKVCLNCFHPKHMARECTSQFRCRTCNEKHHTMLHRDQPRPAATVNATAEEETMTVATAVIRNKVSLPIVAVQVQGVNGRIRVMALLDSGSTSTLCTERVLSAAGLKSRPYSTMVSTVTDDRVKMEGAVTSMKIVSTYSGKEYTLKKVFSRPTLNLTSSCMALPVDTRKWPHLTKVPIQRANLSEVELLIGQDNHHLLKHDQTVEGPEETDPHAILTPLGWYVGGPVGGEVDREICCTFLEEPSLEASVQRFWEVDDVSACAEERGMSMNDKKVLEFWEDKVTHNGTRYTLPIPFKKRPLNLKNNRSQAIGSLRSQGKRLLKNDKLRVQYTKGIRKNFTKDYAEPVDETEEVEEGSVYYLTHQAVFHPRKPDDPRVVFNASLKYLGLSLNDYIYPGPDLMNKLIDVLLNLRADSDVVAGDVKGMFSQILVDYLDRNTMRFFWWKDDVVGGEIVCYRMKTHIFGGVWSPSAANFILQRTARDFGHLYDPEAADMIKKSFYVDDGMRAVSTAERGTRLLLQVKELLARGGFNFTKFASNNIEILRPLPVEDLAQPLDEMFAEDASPRYLLGSGWIPRLDMWSCQADLPEKPDTKRGVLSCMASLYDPLGLITPVVMVAKALFQRCTRKSLKWDEALEGETLSMWQAWKKAVTEAEPIKVRRTVLTARASLEDRDLVFCLHLFSDAAEPGYGAAAYVLVAKQGVVLGVELLLAKGRLAPLKTMRIPRLELAGAHMAVQIEQYVRRTFVIPIAGSWFWVDSTIVLWYIFNPDKRPHTYVANRLGYMMEHTTQDQWKYVPTLLNPADMISRGALPDELRDSYLWFHGPIFLLRGEEEWPRSSTDFNVDHQQLELKSENKIMTIEKTIEEKDEPNPTTYLTEYWSSWYKMKKSVVYLVRFVVWRARKKLLGAVSCTELKNAELALIGYLQREKILNKGLQNTRKYQKLFPLEVDGIIRVGGRLNKATIHPQARNPMVVPSSALARAILWDVHVQTGHSGALNVLQNVRRKYWLMRGRRNATYVVGRCFQCRRYKASSETPPMADLPRFRVVGDRPPFADTGVDYFGPIVVKTRNKENKRYGCMFTCMTTRAVHIEMSWSLDMDSCISAILRFGGRRGLPDDMYSDNGKNFVGTNNEWTRSIAEWNQEKIADELRQRGCNWHFNPPAASHMGGVWERQIRSARVLLMNLLTSQRLTEESLLTFMCLAEDIMNNRPLTPMSSDPRDLEALTPNHFLRLNTRVLLPLGVFTEGDRYRKRWRQVMYLSGIFWQRWRGEYLPLLQIRTKWFQKTRNIMVGDVVILKEEFSPRNCWPLGRIVEVCPDSEGIVRVVVLKTKKGKLKRPVHKVCLIEGQDRAEDSEFGD